MLTHLSCDHPQYNSIMRDVMARFPGGPKPEPRDAFPDEMAALRVHLGQGSADNLNFRERARA